MAKREHRPDKIVTAALDLAARLGWRHVSLAEVAQEAGVGLAELYHQYPSKDAILAGFSRAIDEAVLAGAQPPSEEESVKDRLFDLLMRRFDALKPYKSGLAAVMRDGAGGPVEMLCSGARLYRAMAWTLEAAGVSSAGIAGDIKTKGLMAVFLSALRVWLRDDTEDQSRTMAALDRSLARAESLATTVFGRRYPRPGPQPEQPAPPPG